MTKSKILSLTILSFPLAFVGIPIYLNIADFYASKFAIDLTLIGILLIVVRIIDMIQDPIVGVVSDYFSNKKHTRRRIINFSALLLIIGFYLTFNPVSSLTNLEASIWFVVSLCLTYLAFNFVVINFESAIAITAKDENARITLNSFKEFFGLLGMIMAFLLPGICQQFFALSLEKTYLVLSVVFAVILLVASFLFKPQDQIYNNKRDLKFLTVLQDKKFRNFTYIIFLNSIAVSLPAANMNFYVRDVLSAEEMIPWALSIYFISACLFIPLWKISFDKFGILKSWIISIIGAVLVFFCAYFLTAANAKLFYLICLLSGLFLGADLIAIPAILAKITKDNAQLTSSYFSLWNLTAKLALMVAASGSLIILGFYGYSPAENIVNNLHIISFFYAALPCVLKAIVMVLIYKFKKYEN